MAISQKSVGSWAANNATTQTVTLPTHAAGDMLIVRAGCKPYTATPHIDTSGWAAVATAYANGTTANGDGVGSVVVCAWYKIATSSSETNPVITWDTTAAPGMAVAVCYQKASNESWVTPTGDGGPDNSAGTSHSATIQSHVSVTAGDMIDFFSVQRDNTTQTVPTITQSGVTFGTVAEYPTTAGSSTTSNDIAADGGYRLASSGTSSAAAIVTGTLSTSETGASWMTRLRVEIIPKSTAVAEISLASHGTPEVDTNHSIVVRARTTSGSTGTIRAALYEGANNRSGDLESSALTNSFADYTLPITEANAANITNYSNLSIRLWGYDINGNALVFEVAELYLVLPVSIPSDVIKSYIQKTMHLLRR